MEVPLDQKLKTTPSIVFYKKLKKCPEEDLIK